MVPKALEGKVRGGNSLDGAGKSGCGVKVAVRGQIEARSASTRSYPILSVNMLVSLTAVNQIDPYDSDSGDGGSEFPSQSTIPQARPAVHDR
jgi:hypothetical protein